DRPARARRRPPFRDARRARREPGGDRGDHRRVGRSAPGRRDRRGDERRRRDLRPDLHDRRHLRRPAVPGTRDAREARGPGVRRVHRARDRAEVLRDALRRPLVRDVGRGQPQPRRLRRPARAVRRGARRARAGGRALSRVTICEVAPRDGLQNEATHLEPSVRADLVNRLAAAGVPRIEAVSFVNPQRVPQMAGAEEVVAAIEREPGVVYAGLALNERGYDRLLASALDEVHYAFAASETFNQRNQNASVEESAQTAERIVRRAHADALRATVTIGVSFGCPFEGAVDPGFVLDLAGRFAAAGADEIVFADTVGVGVPRQARELVAGGVKLGVPVGVHLHNTRNTGFANAFAALEAGA